MSITSSQWRAIAADVRNKMRLEPVAIKIEPSDEFPGLFVTRDDRRLSSLHVYLMLEVEARAECSV